MELWEYGHKAKLNGNAGEGEKECRSFRSSWKSHNFNCSLLLSSADHDTQCSQSSEECAEWSCTVLDSTECAEWSFTVWDSTECAEWSCTVWDSTECAELSCTVLNSTECAELSRTVLNSTECAELSGTVLNSTECAELSCTVSDSTECAEWSRTVLDNTFTLYGVLTRPLRADRQGLPLSARLSRDGMKMKAFSVWSSIFYS